MRKYFGLEPQFSFLVRFNIVQNVLIYDIRPTSQVHIHYFSICPVPVFVVFCVQRFIDNSSRSAIYSCTSDLRTTYHWPYVGPNLLFIRWESYRHRNILVPLWFSNVLELVSNYPFGHKCWCYPCWFIIILLVFYCQVLVLFSALIGWAATNYFSLFGVLIHNIILNFQLWDLLS